MYLPAIKIYAAELPDREAELRLATSSAVTLTKHPGTQAGGFAMSTPFS